MAGSRIKGITVEIGGDTTKLQTALKGINSEIKNTQSQLKDVEKLLKLDPGNTELLAQKQKLLSSAVSETKEKLATLKTAAEQANQALANGDISKEQYDALQREIIETEEDLKKLEAQANQSATAVQKIATAGESLKSAGDKVSSAGEKLLHVVLIVVLVTRFVRPGHRRALLRRLENVPRGTARFLYFRVSITQAGRKNKKCSWPGCEFSMTCRRMTRRSQDTTVVRLEKRNR